MITSRTRTRGRAGLIAAAAAALGLALAPQAVGQPPATHTIALTAIEIKGGTTADKLAPPPLNPADLSKGYGFKRPGEADKTAPQRWEVSAYLFAPSFAVARQGDTIVLTAFVVNGDQHEVWVVAPGGQRVTPPVMWNRGREYRLQFVAEEPGTYQLVCSDHAPTMTASFLVLPR